MLELRSECKRCKHLLPDSSLSYNACWSCDLPGPHAGRQEILQTHIHKQGLPLGADVTVDSIAASTTGFTGADLANLINEAALLAGRSGKGNPRRQHPSQRAHLCLFVAELAFWFVEFAFGFLPSRCRGRLLVAELEGNLAVHLLLGPPYAASLRSPMQCDTRPSSIAASPAVSVKSVSQC